jgi:hypothetical protein
MSLRQIRNAFQTAIAIAAYDANQKSGGSGEVVPVLDASQFEMVAQSAKQFDKYLNKARGLTDAQITELSLERADSYVSSGEEEQDKKRSKKGDKKTSKKLRNSKREESDEDSEEDSEKDSDGESKEDSDWNSEDDDEEDRRPTKKRKTE